MVIQIWNEGNCKNGASVQIKLPIVTAPRNIFPTFTKSPVESTSADIQLAKVYPGDDLSSHELPKFLSQISKAFELPEPNSEELRPSGLVNTLVVEGA